MNSLDRLTGFYWVARTGGYSRAARAFPYPITQPGVHQQVSRLEAELGVRLFRRTGKDRMVPTPQGDALLAVVRPFLERLDATVASLRTGAFGGTLRVGAAPLLVQELLPRWLGRFHRERPDVGVSLTELSVADPDALRSGTLDLLLDHVPEPPDDVMTRTVGRLWAFLVVPASHPAARARRPDLRALRALPFLVYRADAAARDLQRRAVQALGGAPHERQAADSTASLLGFVAAGLGYSVVPALHAQGPRRAGVRAFRLRLPGSERLVHAAWLRGIEHPLVSAALALAPRVFARG